MFSAVTQSIVVTVVPTYLPDESEPEAGKFLWSYRVIIENHGDKAVQLISRSWDITDGNGVHRQVNGPGVIGQQPVIEPGHAFEYTSGCPLTTSNGIMSGSYKMVSENGETLLVTIPAFSLDVPYERRVLN